MTIKDSDSTFKEKHRDHSSPISHKRRSRKSIIYCAVCGKKVEFYPSMSPNKKYCSTKCKSEDQRKRIVVQCSYCGKELSITPSRLKWSKIRGHGKIYCNQECHNAAQVDKSHPSWIKDRSLIKDPLHSARQSKKMREWEQAIFTRDNFTCQSCGAVDVHLVAHHLKGFTKHPDIGFNLDNGKTLCEKCHRKAHKSMCCRHLVFNADDVKEIVAMRKNGRSLSQIEGAFDVSAGHLCNILNGKIKAYHQMLSDAGWTIE